MSRRGSKIAKLIIFCLLLQALVPLGQVLTRPGSTAPVIICSQFGTLIVDAETGEPLQDEGGTTRAGDLCVVCQVLTATGLVPEAAGCRLPATRTAAVQAPAPETATPQPMAFRFGIFARPPPARA